MPVYEHNYQTWEGHRRGPMLRWLAIPKFAYLEFFKVRVFIGLFFLAWVQFIARMGYIYVMVNEPLLKAMNFKRELLPQVNSIFFKSFVDVQLLFGLLFAFLLGAGLISKDLQHSALVLYFSKPISRMEYFLGKFFALFSLCMVLTWFQGIFLFIVQYSVAPDYSQWRQYFWTDYYYLAFSVTLYSLAGSILVSLLILAASSLTKNARYAGTTMVVYIIGSGIFGGMLNGFLGVRYFDALSPLLSLYWLGCHLFRDPDAIPLGPVLALASVAANCLLCAGILKWQLDRAARYGR